MKIIKIIGGIGNQMFQYALAIALQKKWKNEEIKLDLHGFNGYHKHQGYQLDEIFGYRFNAASLIDVARLAWPYPHYQLWRVGSRMLPKRKTMVCEAADCHFQSDLLNLEGNLYYDGIGRMSAISKTFAQRLSRRSSLPRL